MSEPIHVENTGGWIVSQESGPFRIIDSPNKIILKIHDDGTVELGEGVTLDEASKAFWEYVQAYGPKAKLDKALALLKEFPGRYEDMLLYDHSLEDFYERVNAFLESEGER